MWSRHHATHGSQACGAPAALNIAFDSGAILVAMEPSAAFLDIVGDSPSALIVMQDCGENPGAQPAKNCNPPLQQQHADKPPANVANSESEVTKAAAREISAPPLTTQITAKFFTFDHCPNPRCMARMTPKDVAAIMSGTSQCSRCNFVEIRPTRRRRWAITEPLQRSAMRLWGKKMRLAAPPIAKQKGSTKTATGGM